MFSLIVPVYKNRESLSALLIVLQKINEKMKTLEVVFVVDGSPDESYLFLKTHLISQPFQSQLILLSRNFGSFAAIRAGLESATGNFFAVMAADMQDPPELIVEFFEALKSDEADVTLGIRKGRSDPLMSRIFSTIFWSCYRHFIQKDMPPGGIDVFGCNRLFLDQLISLNESNSSLIGLLFWLGFRRKFIPYVRLPRKHGKSAWSFRRKLKYLSDSLFSFSDLPIRILILFGIFGVLFSVGFGFFAFLAKIYNWVRIPGYTTTLLITLFFTGFNSLGFGIIGSYIWRAFENSKARPQTVIMRKESFKGQLHELFCTSSRYM